MKKFKIIEEGRIVDKDEMKNIHGGDYLCSGGVMYTGCNRYEDCNSQAYVSCMPNAVHGYMHISVCDSVNGHSTCNKGWTYSSCISSQGYRG